MSFINLSQVSLERFFSRERTDWVRHKAQRVREVSKGVYDASEGIFRSFCVKWPPISPETSLPFSVVKVSCASLSLCLFLKGLRLWPGLLLMVNIVLEIKVLGKMIFLQRTSELQGTDEGGISDETE